MTTTIDFDALQVSEGPKVTLLGNLNVGGGIVGSDFADFSSFASLSVDVKVQRTSVRAPAPALTVLVEHSDDGLSWSTAETFTFTDDGEQTASLVSPKAHVRASASGSGAEWYVKSVNVAPISGGGGGSSPFATATVTLTDAQIKALPTTPIDLVPAPGAGKVLVPIFAWLHLTWVADYTNITNDSVIKFQPSDGSGGVLAAFSEVIGGVSNLLADGASHTAYSAVRLVINPANALATLAVGQLDDDPGGINVGLQLAATNTGNYTGGNVGNSLKVTVYYAMFTN